MVFQFPFSNSIIFISVHLVQKYTIEFIYFILFLFYILSFSFWLHCFFFRQKKKKIGLAVCFHLCLAKNIHLHSKNCSRFGCNFLLLYPSTNLTSAILAKLTAFAFLFHFCSFLSLMGKFFIWNMLIFLHFHKPFSISLIRFHKFIACWKIFSTSHRERERKKETE